MNNIVFIVFDSARYDAVTSAHTPNLNSIGKVQLRWSFASWTLPSHAALLTGLMPHRNSPGVLASAEYRDDLSRWSSRLRYGERPIQFSHFVPFLSLPKFLADLGYQCEAFVSLPVLNPQTIVAQHFHEYTLMPEHNNLGAIVRRLRFDGNQPRFYFINTGETHYPYILAGEHVNDLPVLAGLHGTYRDLDKFLIDPVSPTDLRTVPFNSEQLSELRKKQIKCVENLDRTIGQLLACTPHDTYFIITSDHGELFGEDGYFGHGPIIHKKVFEVFLVEGQHPNGIDNVQIKQNTISSAVDSESDRIVLDRLRKLGYL